MDLGSHRGRRLQQILVGHCTFTPIKPVLKPPGTKRLHILVEYDKLHSHFGFKLTLRRYIPAPVIYTLPGFFDQVYNLFESLYDLSITDDEYRLAQVGALGGGLHAQCMTKCMKL